MLAECVICLTPVDYASDRRLACNHVFHADCIERWLSSNNSCPVCRTVVTRETQEVAVDDEASTESLSGIQMILHLSCLQSVPCIAMVISRSFPMDVAAAYSTFASATSILAACTLSPVLVAVARTATIAALISDVCTLGMMAPGNVLEIVSLCTSFTLAVFVSAILAHVHGYVVICTRDELRSLRESGRRSRLTAANCVGVVSLALLFAYVDILSELTSDRVSSPRVRRYNLTKVWPGTGNSTGWRQWYV